MEVIERDCTSRCRSKQQATQLLTAVVRGDFTQIRTYCWWLCSHFSHLSDPFGRTALHAAASCGQHQVVQWLVSKCGTEIDQRDLESGWTALHRALFYGQLSAARVLLQHGSNLRCTDHEGLNPLDLLVKDRPPHVEYRKSDPSEVYMWGANASFNLGQGNDLSKITPELLDSFRRDNISVKQVVLCKYHSAFLSNDGRLLTCGHGLGGRLGQNTEQTSLTPAAVKGLGSGQCLQVAAGQDHLLLLMEGGQVFSCGLNTYHQLGHPYPPPERLLLPRPLSLKLLKGIDTVQGVAAAKYHSVIYTKDALFTFGLNAGQLGHPQGERTQLLPRQVSPLNQKDLLVTHVAASDGATVCATSKGDVYVLHQYQCRRIASRQLDLKKVCVVGGHLDSRYDVSGLHEGGGTELKVLLLTLSGKLLLWREGCPILRRCLTLQGPQPVVSDTCLSHFGLGLVTEEGTAFWGNFRQPALPSSNIVTREEATKNVPLGGNWAQLQTPPPTPPALQLPSTQKQPQQQQRGGRALVVFLDREECELIKAKRIPTAHRATSIYCDPKSRNMALVQSHPKACLVELPVLSCSPLEKDLARFYRETCHSDDVHDVLIKLQASPGKIYPCHRFVLASRSEPFRRLLSRQKDGTKEELILEGVESAVMTTILDFIYANSCDVLKEGKLLLVPKEGQQMSKGMKNQGNKKNRSRSNPEAELLTNQLKEASKRFGLKLLTEKLQDTHVVGGRLKSSRDPTFPRLEFDRQAFPEFCDVWLQSEDGVEFPCHKCLLVARLEYFQHMLQAPVWRETSSRAPIRLPMPSRVLGLLLDFLYTNRADKLYESEDADFLCQCLVISDQLLIPRLKEMCEGALVDMVTLKNACELLELSHVYNAAQLKASCQQYILFNLAALLEIGGLDVLSDEAMDSLTNAYRRLVPGMCRRVMTPSPGRPPSQEHLQSLCTIFPAPDPCQDMNLGIEQGPKASSRSTTKRRAHQRKISERSEDERSIFPDTPPTTPVPEIQPLPVNKGTPKLSPTPEHFPTISPAVGSSKPLASVGRILKPWIQPEGPPSPLPIQPLDLGRIIQDHKEHAKDAASKTQMLANVTGVPKKKLTQRERKALGSPVSIPSPSNISVGLDNTAWGCASSPPNAWSLRSPPTASAAMTLATSPPTEVPLLEQILKEESLRNVAPLPAKALHLINLEDKAMEELSSFYSVHANPEERITIIRVTPQIPYGPVSPMASLSKWSKRLI